MANSVAKNEQTSVGNQVPPSIMSASRGEVDLQLEVIEGQLPEDIQGHVFIVAPAGFVDDVVSEDPPIFSKQSKGDALLNGDGMIYRVDFDQPGQAHFKARLVKTPDYYADLGTYQEPDGPPNPYHVYRFGSHGITRFAINLCAWWRGSLGLGIRNQLNTAFYNLKFAQDESDRLLVTYDAGRPYEIDPQTLDVVTPVGRNDEWVGELDNIPGVKTFPFKSILSTAHPACDYTGDGTFFTVNYGRSLLNLLLTIPLVAWLVNLPAVVRALFSVVLVVLDIWVVQSSWGTVCKVLWLITSVLLLILLNIPTVRRIDRVDRMLQNFTNVLRWKGSGDLEQWRLVIKNDQDQLIPVSILQTIHQIGVTRDYLVIMDTAFVAGLLQLTNVIPRWFRPLLEKDALPNSQIYLVPRAGLVAGQTDVEVVKVIVPLEAAHFLVDYENPGDRVTIHVAHLCGMQVAEWLRKDDISKLTGETVAKYLRGMQHDEMDIGRMGRYEVEGSTGIVFKSQVIADTDCTWAVDLYAYLDRFADGQPLPQLKHVYWGSFGLWQQLMTRYVYQAYRDYRYRLITLEQMLALANMGQPSCLFHLETQPMAITDYFQFPTDCMALSPQFIPRGDGNDGANGYLSCTIFWGDRNEIWIFDAANLRQGPCCKLSHPELNIGFTLHTVWWRSLPTPQGSYNVPVVADYQPLVSQNGRLVQRLFNEKVYPHFPEPSTPRSTAG